MSEKKETIIHIGTQVLCDFCGDDYTNSPATGGILFQSKAVCPECTKRMLPDIKRYGEERYIRGQCPEGKAFAAWVNEDLRGGSGAFIKIRNYIDN